MVYVTLYKHITAKSRVPCCPIFEPKPVHHDVSGGSCGNLFRQDAISKFLLHVPFSLAYDKHILKKQTNKLQLTPTFLRTVTANYIKQIKTNKTHQVCTNMVLIVAI
jgi:hypothetical protein